MHLPSLNLDTPRFVARDEQGLPKSWTFEAGRSLGDGLALVTGILEIVGGGGAAAGGGTLCVTGVGCIVGAPAVAGGVALGLHGSATSSSALTSIAARLGVVFHSATNNSPENNNAENANIGERSETWGVDPATRAADEAAGVIVNGSYIKNPTARKLADIVTESGKIGSKQMTGQFMYVVDELGNIIIGTRAGQRMPHPTLIGGKNPRVLAAGIVDIRGGKIYSVNNASGHFKPGANSLEAARESFTKLPNKLFHKNFQGFKPYDQ
ncbi:hypothetical protein [Nostoc sp. NMS9]|uniref:hypothetical protein n=1 Tax=Nostoc sp. NMS9 TaxID=2815393 RepID=UPI0025EA385C|nr:hypothetical protein [Nostoc sp. NMS9]MBN3941583.1 hypothetical protein [Nostoc sp. NMS9]